MSKTYEEYLEEISTRKEKDYPVVVRTTEPLLIRFDETSLLVNDTNFFVKTKRGLAFTGYEVYTSGLGTPIYEKKLSSASISYVEGSAQVISDDTWSESKLREEAKNYLNRLEARIAVAESDNEIKKAIDRLCWQLHYDITETSTTTLPEGFAPDIIIDKPTNTIYKDFYVLNNRICSDAEAESAVDRMTLCNRINKVAVNLRADGEQEYTISRALREGDQSSVSQATHDQTVLEAECFNEISVNQLGAFGSTYGEAGAEHQTLYEALGAYGGHDATPLSENINEINNIKLGDLGTVIGVRSNKTLCDIVGSYSDSSSTKTISTELDKIGDPSLVYSDQSYTTNTLFGRLGNAVDDNAQTPVNSVIYQVLHRAGTRNLNTANIDADSPIGLVRADIASVGSDVSSISSDTTSIKSSIGSASTSSTLWYDVIHNAGTGTPGATAQTNSLQSKVQSVINTIGSSTTSGTLYYDVLYNAGIKETSANVDANSLQGRIQNIQNVLGQKKTGVNLDAMTYLDYLYNNV